MTGKITYNFWMITTDVITQMVAVNALQFLSISAHNPILSSWVFENSHQLNQSCNTFLVHFNFMVSKLNLFCTYVRLPVWWQECGVFFTDSGTVCIGFKLRSMLWKMCIIQPRYSNTFTLWSCQMFMIMTFSEWVWYNDLA